VILLVGIDGDLNGVEDLIVGDMTGQRRHTVAGDPPAAYNQQYWQLWTVTDFDLDAAVDLRHLVDVITARRPPSCPSTRSPSGYSGRCSCIAWPPSGLYTLSITAWLRLWSSNCSPWIPSFLCFRVVGVG
jgi:hypothetical protein